MWNAIAARLLARYGQQGWWPLGGRAGEPGFDAGGYHPGIFGVPAEGLGRFEIAVGAVLTQNTAWRNVELALANLRAAGSLNPEAIATAAEPELAALVRSAGYHNQKARKLRRLAETGLSGGWWADAAPAPARDDLLALWGVGPETADSIRLYAWHQPEWVVDAYARRLLSRLAAPDGAWPCSGICRGAVGAPDFDPAAASYETLRRWFMAADAEWGTSASVLRAQEDHARIVCHAKEHCRAKPACVGCPLAGCPLAG